MMENQPSQTNPRRLEARQALLPLKERLIVGLDVADTSEAKALVDKLGDTVEFYKIGYQLVLAGGTATANGAAAAGGIIATASGASTASGLDFAKELVAQGKKVFLDMKLLDIDNTIAKAVENAVKLGVSMLSLHAYPKAMRAAVKAAKGSSLCLLGVTVLTSMNAEDLKEAGYGDTPENLVLQRAHQAVEAGMGGLVASAAEARALRKIIGVNMALVTPGIRLPGSDKGDQKRIMAPSEAIVAGASHLVVARPVIQAADPKAAALAILSHMAEGLPET